MFRTFNLENTTKHKPTYATSRNTRLLEHKSRESYLQSNPQRSHVKIKYKRNKVLHLVHDVVLTCLGHMIQHLARISCFNKMQSTQYKTQHKQTVHYQMNCWTLGFIFSKRFAARLWRVFTKPAWPLVGVSWYSQIKWEACVTEIKGSPKFYPCATRHHLAKWI